MAEPEEAQALRAHGIAGARADRLQPAVAAPFRTRCDRRRDDYPRADVADVFSRDSLALVDKGFGSRRVARVLDEVIAQRGRPQAIRCDNGPEFTSPHFLAWAPQCKIELRHVQPGRSTQTADADSFHGPPSEAFLRVSWFTSLFAGSLPLEMGRTGNSHTPGSAYLVRLSSTCCLYQSYGKDVGSAI